MTIAQNVLSVASNWSNNTIGGTNYIYSGHNDSAPSAALAASTDDTLGYANETNTGGNQRRTLKLTNNQVIWDLAGNVYEWTTGKTNGMTAQQPGFGSGWAWRQWAAVTTAGTLAVNQSPSTTGLYGASSWTSDNGIGQIYSSADDTGLRSFYRGGYWNSNNVGGLLSVSLNGDASGMSTYVGFRVAQ
jgi:hypothetical protein